jgi:predicted phage terminase large subunit-like protein
LDNELREILRISAKTNFVAFCYFYDYEFFKERPFLKEVAKVFQKVDDGEYEKVSVSFPPRAGKSYITTLLCAWTLGKYPTESIMRNTCSATLSRKLSYDTREVLKSEKFQEVFPNVKLSSDKASVDGWNTNQSKQVGYFGQGVGGTIIGFGASKLAITDDLFRSMEDALSETIREKTHSWKHATHDSRIEKGCKQIDIGTRWVRDDIIGYQSEKGYYDKEIIVSALTEDNKSFCEAVQTTEKFLEMKQRLPLEIWEAEYQQKPIDIEGRLFENLQTFTDVQLIKDNSEGCLAYIDVADEGGDYLCMVVGHLYQSKVYITDVVFTKGNTDVTIPLCVALIKSNNIPYTVVETNGMGALFVKMLRKEVSGHTINGITNSTNKTTRIFMNSAFVINNMLFVSEPKGQYQQFIEALARYSHEGKNKNDDAPDSITGLALFYQNRFRSKFI